MHFGLTFDLSSSLSVADVAAAIARMVSSDADGDRERLALFRTEHETTGYFYSGRKTSSEWFVVRTAGHCVEPLVWRLMYVKVIMLSRSFAYPCHEYETHVGNGRALIYIYWDSRDMETNMRSGFCRSLCKRSTRFARWSANAYVGIDAHRVGLRAGW